MNMSDIRVGDDVRLTRVGLPAESFSRRIVVADTGSIGRGTWLSAEDGRQYNDEDGWRAELLIKANRIPYGPGAIIWRDVNDVTSVAVLSGHPGNGGWDYNGRRVGEPELLAIIGDAPIKALDFVRY